MANLLPVVSALMDTADQDHNRILNPDELATLLRALGVDAQDVRTVNYRLDTNNDGVITLDELGEAFYDFFTSDDQGKVGNVIFGALTSKV